MKRSVLVSLAFLVVLVGNVGVLLHTMRNRGEAAGGTLELTEREASLMWMPSESTVRLLQLRWDCPRREGEPHGPPAWMDAAKLTSLGFDCSVAVTDPKAHDHYGAMARREALVVLEYQGAAWKASMQSNRLHATRLFAIDAGRELTALRSLYPDPTRYAIVRGTVKPVYQDRRWGGDGALDTPRLTGWIQALEPIQVFLPRPFLPGIRPRNERHQDRPEGDNNPPRYAVTICWGANQEPWVIAARLLDAGPIPGPSVTD